MSLHSVEERPFRACPELVEGAALEIKIKERALAPEAIL